MSDIIIFSAFLAFVVYLVAGKRKKYAAIAGWTFIVSSLILEVPDYLTLDNILYPVLAILSVPFLVITIRAFLRDEPIVLKFSNAAAVATLIFVPFAFISLLRDALISSVVNQAVWILQSLGYHAQIEGWNIIMQNGFATEIILECTGITAIAIMLGVTAGSENLSLKQGILSFLIVVPPIYFLNILRVVVTFIAGLDQWFAFLPAPAGSTVFGPSYGSFFWAHNVFAEALSILLIIAIAFGLFKIIPGLADFARDLVNLYSNEVKAVIAWIRAKPV